MSPADLLLLTATIAVGFLLAVWFYESLAARDVLVGPVQRAVRRVTRWRLPIVAAYLCTVGLGVPVLVVTWSAVLEIALFVIGSVDRVASVSLVAVSVVGATRILAYVRPKTAHELAKAIPLAMAFMLLTGGALNLEEKLRIVAERPAVIGLNEVEIGFLIALEVSLRLVTDGTRLARSQISGREPSGAVAPGPIDEILASPADRSERM